MQFLNRLILFSAALAAYGIAQRVVHPLPKEVFAAKTVAIVNNTHNEAVEEGALDAFKRWGHFNVVDDTDVADITITFEKKSTHEGKSSQTTGDDGKPSTSYGMTFGSSISMKAALRGAPGPFYTTTAGESKKKAGMTCVTDFQQAYLAGP